MTFNPYGQGNQQSQGQHGAPGGVTGPGGVPAANGWGQVPNGMSPPPNGIAPNPYGMAPNPHGISPTPHGVMNPNAAYGNPTQYLPGNEYGHVPVPPKQPNSVGAWSIGFAIAGTLLSLYPSLFAVFGWTFLFVAFVLGIVGCALHNKKKAPAVWGLVLSILGGIVAVIAVFVWLVMLFDDAGATTGFNFEDYLNYQQLESF